jgi:hypothetical protein
VRRVISSACLVLLVSVVSSCSGPPAGDCGERFNSDTGFLTAERWVELMSPSGLPADAADSTQVYPLDVSTVRPGAQSVRLILDDEIAMHGSFIGQARDAFQRGDQVFLALDTRGRSNSIVQYIVFRHPDGSHDFAEQCWMSEIQASIEAAYGDKAAAKLDQLIGTTGRARTRRLFSRLQ